MDTPVREWEVEVYLQGSSYEVETYTLRFDDETAARAYQKMAIQDGHSVILSHTS